MVHPILAESFQYAPRTAADTITLGAFLMSGFKDIGGYIAAHAIGYGAYVHIHSKLEAKRRKSGASDEFNIPD